MTMLSFETRGRGLIEITEDVHAWTRQTDIRLGLLTLHCQHTSASLLICENVSPAVASDLLAWLERAVPDDAAYLHASEGPDDMPAHIRSVLTGNHLSLPVADGKLMLGRWQGIFLAEHRTLAHQRSIVAHLLGE